MAQYPQLAALLHAVDPRTSEVAFKTKAGILPLKPEIVEKAYPYVVLPLAVVERVS